MAGVFNIANLLSLLRIFLVPLYVWLALSDQDLAALIVFSFAALTDLIDGWLARHFQLVTPLGIVLDPIGDKLLVVSAFLTLAAHGHIPIWMGAVAVGREVLVISGILLLAGFADRTQIKRDIRSSWFGKTGTFLVMTSLVLMMVFLAGWLPASLELALKSLLGLALLMNLASGIDYAIRGFSLYHRLHAPKKPRKSEE